MALLNKWILCYGTMKTVVSDNIKSMHYMLAYDGVLSGISVFYQNEVQTKQNDYLLFNKAGWDVNGRLHLVHSCMSIQSVNPGEQLFSLFLKRKRCKHRSTVSFAGAVSITSIYHNQQR